jgi:hypothetical protein
MLRYNKHELQLFEIRPSLWNVLIRKSEVHLSNLNLIIEVDVSDEMEAFEIKPAHQNLHSSQCHHLSIE